MSLENDEKFYDMRIKHLEFLQSVISRMSNNSFTLKNYCVTIVVGMIGLATAIRNPDALLYTMPFVGVFAVLDANYLRLEKSFRSQYDIVRKSSKTKEPDFLIETGWGENHRWFSALWSWSILLFYSPILLMLLTGYFLI